MVHHPMLTSPVPESQLFEIFKICAAILSGGLAGSFLNEWFRHRRDRVKAIPLIERVNRLLNPELQDITLARIVGTSEHRQLEELKNLREYQLTLRNTSRVHLEDAEVQFEFPTDDVQAWVSRPVLSKTALLDVDARATTPWKKAFRWIIPHLPSGDSVEFTFRAVDPPSDAYDAALYKSEGIILKRVVGELPQDRADKHVWISVGFALISLCLTIYTFRIAKLVESLDVPVDQVTILHLAGCEIKLDSSVEQTNNGFWRLRYQIDNVGDRPCTVRATKISPEQISLEQGRGWNTNKAAALRPRVESIAVSISSLDESSHAISVQAYTVPDLP
jgi:hypothetical protein